MTSDQSAITPPRLASALLRRALPAAHRDSIIGDLQEVFEQRAASRGRLSASVWYGLQAIKLSAGFTHERWRPESQAGGGAAGSTRFDLRGLAADMRYAFRAMWSHPGFSSIAVLSLALGIGLNTAVFTVVDEVLFRPMPVHDPSTLATVYTSEENGEPNGTTSWSDFQDLRRTNEAFDGLAGHSLMMAAFGSRDGNRLIMGEVVTANYFSVLGVPLALGRSFHADEETGEGSHPVAILSHRLWLSDFGGRAAAIGESVVIRNREYTVVGVAPPGFTGLTPGLESELWVPVSMVADTEPITINDVQPSAGSTRLERRGHRWLLIHGRLRPGVTAAAAQSNLDTIMRRLEQEYPRSNEGRGARVVPASTVRIHPLVDGPLRPSGLVLLVAVALVLLVACANLASMLLARGVSRARELALRSALGAGRGRLVRQLFVEHVVLALTGGALGLLVAWWSLTSLLALPLPMEVPIRFAFDIDARVLTFSLLLSLLTAVVFGLLPALRASRTSLVSALKDDGSLRRGSRRRIGAGHVLVTGQVAVSLVLVVSGALLARSLMAARDIDPGFDPSGIAVATVNLGFHGYADDDVAPFFTQALERIQALPGVSAAGLSERMPFSPNVHSTTIAVDGRPEATPEGGLTIDNTRVSPGYFDAMGIPIVEGRNFDARDTLETVSVAIINRTLAERFWPGESPIGRRLRFRNQAGAPIEVVGLVPDHKVRTLGEAPRAFIHFARTQSDAPWGTFVARTSGNVDAVVTAMATELRALDPNIVLMEAQPFDRLIAISLLPVTIGATLIAGLAGLALLLAGIGLYGLIAFSVNRRTREIGIRMALGAGRTRLLRHVLREGLVLVAVGGVLGFSLAALASRALTAVLHVAPLDPLSYGSAALILAVAAAAAAAIPAHRAASVDPLVALRQQ